MPIPLADATASAALILAVIALTLAVGTIAFVIVRVGGQPERADSDGALELLRRELQMQYRPLLVDVLVNAPVPSDIGSATVESELPGLEPQRFDPRTVFTAIERGKVFLSVPLQNAGRGLALLDGPGVRLEGAGVERLEYRRIQRPHVPAGETTRIDLIAGYVIEQVDQFQGTELELTVPYTDFGGAQRTLVILRIVCRGEDAQGPWRAERIRQQSAAERGSRSRVEPEPPAEEPAAQEWPAQEPQAGNATTPTQPGARGEPLTDIWGNPLSERRGRRR